MSAGNTTRVAAMKGNSDDDLEQFLVNRNYVRLYALTFGCGMALVVFIGSLLMVPPPQRKWPKKAPLCGLLPWCLISRLLGYGLVQWETGHLLGYIEYIKETHEILSLYFGDLRMIAFKARAAVACLDFCCNFAMTMALTDATGTIVGEDFWVDQFWVYVFIFTFQILFGIATRLSALGVTMHNRINEYMWFCAGVCVFSMACSVLYTNVIATRSCRSPCVAYNYVAIFLSSQAMGWFLVQPLVLTLKFHAGWGLWYVCKDYLTFTSAAMVPAAVAKLKLRKTATARTDALKEAAAGSMSLVEFQANARQRADDNALEDGMLNVMTGGGSGSPPLFHDDDDGVLGMGVPTHPPAAQTVSSW